MKLKKKGALAPEVRSHALRRILVVRVIAGKYRSRILKGPGARRLRPTSDRLRETLFNVLGPAVEDSDFIDLYAGTGAVGIEAISRGANLVVFIESHPPTARLIRRNLESLEIRNSAEIIEADAIRALERLAVRHIVADFVFLDPPYEEIEEYDRVLEFLDASHLLAPSAVVIAEHSRRIELSDRFTRLECVRRLEQGDAVLTFYRLAAAA